MRDSVLSLQYRTIPRLAKSGVAVEETHSPENGRKNFALGSQDRED
jgi:hypothetical protein